MHKRILLVDTDVSVCDSVATLLRLEGYCVDEITSGEAKFWIEPIVSLASYCKLNKAKLNQAQKLVEKHKDEIIKEWKNYFGKC
ncbi:MAG: DUF4160 domain-containing protein [Candidatus Omnitrophica bacterium]|nr:DUF4160 domain-containing protein [Candidatus Omnitrophota bacterium]